MEEKNSIEDIYADVATLEDLYAFYKEIHQCVSFMFQASQTVESAMNASFNAQRKDAILKYVTLEKTDAKDQGKMHDMLMEIKKKGESFPIVTLKLGYDPTRNHLETFSSWFITRLKHKVILCVLVERTLLGGAYITYNGYFKDYSLKKKLQYVFKDQDFTKKPESNLKAISSKL